MKILVIITGNWGLDKAHTPHIHQLSDFMKELSADHIVDYAGISCYDDFHNYEHLLSFKYKEFSDKKILSRLTEFIDKYRDDLDYDWFIRIRPEVHLLENIEFDTLCKDSINARARVYYGKKSIKYGMSLGGEGMWKDYKRYYWSDDENIVLDDHIIVFHGKNIHKFVPYKVITDNHEWIHDTYYNYIEIGKNVIGMNMVFRRKEGDFGYSGDIHPCAAS